MDKLAVKEQWYISRSSNLISTPSLGSCVLRAALNGLMAKYEVDGHRLEEAINSVLEMKPRLRQKYKRPDPSHDRLYQSEVIHPPNDEANCAVLAAPRASTKKSHTNAR